MSHHRRGETVNALVNSACKLRHQNLYSDLMTIICSDCSNRTSANLCPVHEDIQKHIDYFKNSLRAVVKTIERGLLSFRTHPSCEILRPKLEQLAVERTRPEAYALRPRLYREILDMCYRAPTPGTRRIYTNLKVILQNDLVFRHNDIRQHKAMYRSVFLCAVPRGHGFNF